MVAFTAWTAIDDWRRDCLTVAFNLDILATESRVSGYKECTAVSLPHACATHVRAHCNSHL